MKAGNVALFHNFAKRWRFSPTRTGLARNEYIFNAKTPSPDFIAKKRSFAIGGIIRDHFGNWITRFSGFVGFGITLKAELWAISSGIKVASSLGCNELWIETYSLLACKLLLDSSITDLHEHWNLISFCRSALRRFTDAKLFHTFREGNQCVD
ncbi:putative ribonuclease H-like domain-containing protein [Senna tora]|uniref:Putative ribonuclease H-like domain-containing protein n=1 Tax=Senna tora TaxID=362788 RepID=A0A834TVS9_9FABA|nr:putative ribonuclease H-like domain-containing protein [Senna tora]